MGHGDTFESLDESCFESIARRDIGLVDTKGCACRFHKSVKSMLPVTQEARQRENVEHTNASTAVADASLPCGAVLPSIASIQRFFRPPRSWPRLPLAVLP